MVTGAGRAFCAGADLSGQRFPVGFTGSPQREWFEVQKRYSGVVLKLRRIPQPVVAAVNGPCVGGGFSIAMASDIRVVDPDAFFAAAQVNIGQAASEMGASFLLPRLVGGRAAEILLTGRRVTADEAQRIGLANEVTVPGASRERAVALPRPNSPRRRPWPSACRRRRSTRQRWPAASSRRSLRRTGVRCCASSPTTSSRARPRGTNGASLGTRAEDRA